LNVNFTASIADATERSSRGFPAAVVPTKLFRS